MTCENCNEITLLKQKLFELEKKVNSLKTKSLNTIPLSFVAKELNISRQTLAYHLKTNYEPEVDFYIKDNKIVLNMGILPSIEEYYNA